MSNVQPGVELPRVLIIGGGMHATVVADCIRASRRAWIAGYCDRSGHDAGRMRAIGVAYLGDDAEVVGGLGLRSIHAAILGIAGLRNVERRRALASRFGEQIQAWWPAVHPSAVVAETATVAEGAVILAGATVNPLARIGRHVVLNTRSVVEHDADIADFAVISPGAIVCGGVRVGPGAFVGAGATVLTGVSIGADAVVGAGAVALRDVPAGVTVVGNPARAVERQPAYPNSEIVHRSGSPEPGPCPRCSCAGHPAGDAWWASAAPGNTNRR